MTMKRSCLSILFIFLFILAFGQSKKEAAEIKAVEKLIQKEITAFLAKDWETFESCWLHEPFSRHFVTSKNAFNGKIGWENMKELIKQGFDAEGERGYSITKTEINIQVFGGAAYATFMENYSTNSDENPITMQGFNNAFFVKDDGKWKFVCMNIVNLSSFEVARKNRALVEEYHGEISGKSKTREMFEKYLDAGRDDLIKMNLAVENAFPEFELTPKEIIVEGSRVVVRADFKGVHKGQYGEVPASGNKVKLDMTIFYTVGNGKITEMTPYFDNGKLMEQMGATSF